MLDRREEFFGSECPRLDSRIDVAKYRIVMKCGPFGPGQASNVRRSFSCLIDYIQHQVFFWQVI